MDLGLKGKTALICGASKGIGRACAEVLAQEGVNTILLARTESLLAHAVNAIRSKGGNAQYLVADLSRIDSINSVVERAVGYFDSIDILINNTGGPPSGGNLSFSVTEWEEAFRLTFLSAEELTKQILPLMVKKGWGRVINLTSVSVKQPISGLILSNSIRLAVVGWAKTLAIEYAQYGITINNIATGYTLTDRVKRLSAIRSKAEGKTVDQIIEETSQSIPMKRIADPAEIAVVVTFIASVKSSFITGVTLPVDGGSTVSTL